MDFNVDKNKDALKEVDVPVDFITERIGDSEKDATKVGGISHMLKEGREIPPIHIRPNEHKDGYIVVDGNHRLRAHKGLGRKTIRSVVREDWDTMAKLDFTVKKFGGPGSGHHGHEGGKGGAGNVGGSQGEGVSKSKGGGKSPEYDDPKMESVLDQTFTRAKYNPKTREVDSNERSIRELLGTLSAEDFRIDMELQYELAIEDKTVIKKLPPAKGPLAKHLNAKIKFGKNETTAGELLASFDEEAIQQIFEAYEGPHDPTEFTVKNHEIVRQFGGPGSGHHGHEGGKGGSGNVGGSQSEGRLDKILGRQTSGYNQKFKVGQVLGSLKPAEASSAFETAHESLLQEGRSIKKLPKATGSLSKVLNAKVGSYGSEHTVGEILAVMSDDEVDGTFEDLTQSALQEGKKIK